MNEKTQQLLDRTFDFGVNILKILKKLPDDFIYRIPKGQIARSSISICANYEEAQGAVSKRDFSNKIGISYKEARESLYWLRVLNKLYDEEKYQKDFENFIKEAQELKNIFAAIKKSSKESVSQ
ncbi:MAG: four helix bundle protein [Bacteroidia bacterium]|nr:four helix bundle protein [Bacteroidia bacterium]